MEGGGTARGPKQGGLGLGTQKRQRPSTPTSPAPVPGQLSEGRHRAGRETAAHRTGSWVTKREDRRTQEPVEERGRRAKAGGPPSNQGAPLSGVRTAEGVRREEVGSEKEQSDPTPPAGWPVTPHLQTRGRSQGRVEGPTGRCQVPWEASMAPAVSWKSRSCCRKRMACVGRKQVQEEGQGQDLKVKVTSQTQPLGPFHSKCRARGLPREKGGCKLPALLETPRTLPSIQPPTRWLWARPGPFPSPGDLGQHLRCL